MLRIRLSTTRFPLGSLLVLACLHSAQSLRAQTPVLTITPGPSIRTLDTSVVLPAAIAYDNTGNLYVADAADHVILKRSPAGITTVIAGDHRQDFRGDGGPATAASLDTPIAIALDISGNLYLADGHNHRVRRINASGIITTVAGNGNCGFTGDGGAAIAASLCLPSALAVAPNGSIIIADQRNHRIRSIDSKGTINTIAGNGDQGFSGDNGKAIAAGLDSPAGIAYDGDGNLLIADTHNQRIRRVDSSGIIITIAGTGKSGSAGDNGNATAAQLALPTGITVTSAGDILIADRGNQRIRAISDSNISTLSGTGDESSLGDGSATSTASLASPRAVAANQDNVTIAADALRQSTAAFLSFGFQKTSIASAPRTVLLTNSGKSALILRSLVLPNGFVQGQGSCATLPAPLATGSSCTLAIAFAPTVAAETDSLAQVRVDGLPLQSFRLTGTGYSPATSLTLLPLNVAYSGINTPLVATLLSSGPVSPTGMVVFFDGGKPIAQAPLIAGSATVSTLSLSEGAHSITATYSGDPNYEPSTSQPLTATITTLPTFTLAQDTNVTSAVSVASGSVAQFHFFLNVPAGALTSPVTFSVAGLPAGAKATFSPPSLADSGTITLNIDTSASRAWFPFLLLMTTAGISRRKIRCLQAMILAAILTSLQGCGSATTKAISHSYSLTVSATATTATGTVVQQQINFALTVL